MKGRFVLISLEHVFYRWRLETGCEAGISVDRNTDFDSRFHTRNASKLQTSPLV